MKYQDYVIKDGKFVGKFDEMYQKFNDPWLLQNSYKKLENLHYRIIYYYCERVRSINKIKKKLITLEIWCGYPQISNKLLTHGFNSFGTDISETVIKKSKQKFPKLKNKLFVSEFLNFNLYNKINPDIFILSDITWYILPELGKFISYFKKLKKKYLIHSLAVYEKNKQKYGKNYFCDLQSIKKYFKLNYLSSGYVQNASDDQHTFFLGKK